MSAKPSHRGLSSPQAIRSARSPSGFRIFPRYTLPNEPWASGTGARAAIPCLRRIGELDSSVREGTPDLAPPSGLARTVSGMASPPSPTHLASPNDGADHTIKVLRRRYFDGSLGRRPPYGPRQRSLSLETDRE